MGQDHTEIRISNRTGMNKRALLSLLQYSESQVFRRTQEDSRLFNLGNTHVAAVADHLGKMAVPFD